MAWIALLVTAVGALGGVLTSFIAGEFKLPHKDQEAKVWRPGWIGNVLMGAAAGVVLWALYGPHANDLVVGAGGAPAPSLKLAELGGALVSGIGGSRILASEVEKQLLAKANDALSGANKNLAKSLQNTLP